VEALSAGIGRVPHVTHRARWYIRRGVVPPLDRSARGGSQEWVVERWYLEVRTLGQTEWVVAGSSWLGAWKETIAS
jgi:hypothetical protein